MSICYRFVSKLNLHIVVSFFLLSIANADINDNIMVLKYLGLAILLISAIKKLINDGMTLEKKDFMFSIVVYGVFLVQTCLHGLSIRSTANAFFFYGVLFVLTMLGKNVFKNIDDYISCFVGTFFASLIGLLYNPSQLIQQISGAGSRHRIHGSFMHPNALGSIVLICVICLIVIIAYYDKFFSKISRLIPIFCIFGILAFLILLTDSRGYMILFWVSIFTYLLNRVSVLPKWLRLIIYVLLCIGIYYIVYFFWIYYATQDLSYSSRIEGFNSINLEGIRYWIGYGMVSSEEIDYSVLEAGSMEIAWVKMYYKVGIIGVFLFISILIYMLMRVFRIEDIKLKFAFYATFVTFMVGSFVESSMVTIFNVNPIFMWAALSSIPYLYKKG